MKEQDSHKPRPLGSSNRRNFLKTGITIGAATIAAPILSNAAPITRITSNPAIKRTLGSGENSIEVSPLGLGCMGMSWNRSFVPDRKYMIDTIRKAYDRGVNFFDTAEAYGPHINEVLVGEAIKPFRKNIQLCTKFGFAIENGKFTKG